MMYLVTAVVVIVFTIIGFALRRRRIQRLYWEKQGVPYASGFGILFFYKFFTQPIHEILLQMNKKYGRIYGGFEFKKPSLTVCEPELLRDILVKDFNNFNYRRDFDGGDEVINNMVSILKGEDWKRVRTVITPAFTSKRMRQMSHIINECSRAVVETLKKYAEDGKPADMKSIFGAYTLDVIASAAFATKIDSLNDPDNVFVKNVKSNFINPPIFRILAFLFLPTFIVKRLKIFALQSSDFFKNVIIQVIKERKETGKKYDDMLQLLLDAKEELESEKSKEPANLDQEDEVDHYGSVTNSELEQKLKYKTLSEIELVAQCILFFLVGYETTATTLSFISYSLALNPECQEKLIAEVDEVFDKHGELNYDVIRDMKYLDYVLSETLRMYPALSRSERTATEDYKLGDTGVVIEKGTTVGFNIHAMHYDPEFFPNPEEFDPERFSPENSTHPQYAYLPFGAGPRNCLGMRFAMMEIKLVMSHILRNYKFKRGPTTKVPPAFKAGQGLLSVYDLPLNIEKRSPK